MGFIAAGLAVAAIGAGVSAKANSDASKRAARTNEQNVKDTNAANYQLFRESRGSEGNAILPIYAGGSEKQIFNNLMSAYGMGGTEAERYARGQKVLESLQPSITGTTDYINSIYNGANLNQQLANWAPLWDARTNAAEVNAQAIRQTLNDSLAAQRAGQAQRGYIGGSTYDANEARRAMLGATQGAAGVRANAIFQNAGEQAQTRNADLANRQSMLSAPFANAQNVSQIYNLPSEQAYGGLDALLKRINFFNIGTGRFQQQNLPEVQPTTGSGGIWGPALMSAGKMMSSYGLGGASGGFSQAGTEAAGGAWGANNGGGKAWYPTASSQGWSDPYGGG